MVGNSAIHYDVAQATQVVRSAEQRHARAMVLNQFRNAFCDHMSMADLEWYATESGKDILWLFARARFSDPAGALGALMETAYRELDVDMMEFILDNVAS